MSIPANAEGPGAEICTPPASTQRGGPKQRARFVEFPARCRRVISEHRQRRRGLDWKISDQSRRALDWTNFFLADVQVSFGAFLAFYLANLEWSKQDVGFVLTVGGLAGVLAQIPGGALADAVPWKRGLAALGAMARSPGPSPQW
jgi:hypothetical protein